MMEGKPRSIDSYLAELEDDQRAALKKLREVIRDSVPEAEEGFGYGLPAFRLHGKILVAIGAAKGHCALYPMSPDVVAAHREDLKDFDLSKGAIRFHPASPLPPVIVRRLIRARAKEISPD